MTTEIELDATQIQNIYPTKATKGARLPWRYLKPLECRWAQKEEG